MRALTLSLTLALAPSLAPVAPARAQSPTELTTLAQSARQSPRDADAQRAHGRALLRAARYREAERAFQSAARLRGGGLEALFEVANVAFAEGDYRKSRTACRALERAERTAPLTHICNARAFLVWNRAGRAFEQLEAAAARGGDALFEYWLALGDANRLRFEVSPAEDAYRRAIGLDGARFEPHLGLAQLYASSRREADALAQLREAQQKDAGVPEVWYELGRRTAGADGRELLERAVQVRPTWTEALVALAEHQLAGGDRAGARRNLEAALARDGRNADAHLTLGRVLAADGEVDRAQVALMRALELVPNMAAARIALGQLEEQRGRTEDAFEHFGAAANLDPSDPTGLLHSARLAVAQGRDVLATGFLDRLLRTHPNLAAAHAYYGDALAHRGDRDGAAQRYERALRGEGELDRARVEAALREVRRAPQRGPVRQRATAR